MLNPSHNDYLIFLQIFCGIDSYICTMTYKDSRFKSIVRCWNSCQTWIHGPIIINPHHLPVHDLCGAYLISSQSGTSKNFQMKTDSLKNITCDFFTDYLFCEIFYSRKADLFYSKRRHWLRHENTKKE